MTDYNEKIDEAIQELRDLLIKKNTEYGNASFIPIEIFTCHLTGNKSTDSIKYRLDDKLSRIKNTKELRIDDLFDVMGYLILLYIAMRENNEGNNR